MPDLDALAGKRFMKRLLDDKVTRLLGKVVRETSDAALKRDPAAHLARAGLELPNNVTVSLSEEQLKPDQIPRDFRTGLDLNIPLIRIRCFRFCRWFRIGPFVFRRCVYICVLG